MARSKTSANNREVSMSVDHVVLGPDGRIVVPVAARRELGLKSGDLLTVESDGTSLLIRSHDAVIQESQAYFRQFLPPGASAVEELIADRRAEATREEAETTAWLDARRRD
jgi:AbrB family looped-hinge helix DNA binding protein